MIALERRLAPACAHPLLRQRVEIRRRHARRDHRRQLGQHLADQPFGRAASARARRRPADDHRGTPPRSARVAAPRQSPPPDPRATALRRLRAVDRPERRPRRGSTRPAARSAADRPSAARARPPRCRRRAAPAAPPHFGHSAARRRPGRALAPHCPQIRRDASRRTSSSSGTTMSSTISGRCRARP